MEARLYLDNTETKCSMETRSYQQEAGPTIDLAQNEAIVDLKQIKLLKLALECQQRSKTIKTFEDDGPDLPNVIDVDRELNLKKPVDHYFPGEVKYSTVSGIMDMLGKLSIITCGTSGCILDENFIPEFNMYEKDVHFVVDKMIGQGSYGTVELCIDSNSRKRFVVKRIQKPTFRHSEVIVPLHMNHQNITRFLGLIQRDDSAGNTVLELLLEYGGISLNQLLIIDKNLLTVDQIWKLTKQGLEALNYLNKYGIVHLDVKPENTCIQMGGENSLTLKLADFGSAKLPQESLQFIGVTPEYMPPEMCKSFLHNREIKKGWVPEEMEITGKSDCFPWALVTMFMYKKYHILVKLVTSGKESYAGIDEISKRNMHLTLLINIAQDKEFVKNLIPDECDIDMREMLEMLLKHDHRERWSAREALDYIAIRERKLSAVRFGQKQLMHQQDMRDRINLSIQLDGYDLGRIQDIPNIAADAMENETGPVKNSTRDQLRKKLQPYCGKSGSGKGIFRAGSKQSRLDELRERVDTPHVLSHTAVPLTPEAEMAKLSLFTTHQDIQKGCGHYQMTERMKGPVAQPSTEEMGHSPQFDVRSRAVQMGTQIRGSQSIPVAETGGVGEVSLACNMPQQKLLSHLIKILIRKQNAGGAAQFVHGNENVGGATPSVPRNGIVMNNMSKCFEPKSDHEAIWITDHDVHAVNVLPNFDAIM